jgi:cytoskeletal protein CcmA (bactofilin family)
LPHGSRLGIVRARRICDRQMHQENIKDMNPAEGSTVIGKSVNIRGELSGNEDLYIDGDIEGTITLKESKLTIGPDARIRANVSACDVVVFGHLTGNISATGRVDLRQSGLVTGDILAGRLSIEESATLKGRVELRPSNEVKSVSGSITATPPDMPAPGTPLFPQPQA